MTQLDPDVVKPSVLRPKRASRQLNAVIHMPETSRECEDVITQIAAVSEVIDRVGYSIIARGMHTCLLDDPTGGSIDTQKLEKLFLSLSRSEVVQVDGTKNGREQPGELLDETRGAVDDAGTSQLRGRHIAESEPGQAVHTEFNGRGEGSFRSLPRPSHTVMHQVLPQNPIEFATLTTTWPSDPKP